MIALACHPVTNHGLAYMTCTLALIIVIRVCNRLRASFSLREVETISDSHILLPAE